MTEKVFIFSLKSEKGVYAVTNNKEYAELFRLQRNMKLFNERTLILDDDEFAIFSNEMSNYELCEDYLDDGEHDILIVTTIKESADLSESCDYILQTAEFIQRDAKYYPLKNKYLKPIIKLTESITKRDDENPTLNVDTLKLFYFLFRKTFSKQEQPDELNLKFFK